MTKVHHADCIGNTIDQDINVIDNQSVAYKNYTFLGRKLNDQYADSVKILPLRTCLLHNKSDKILVETEPKWITDLLLHKVDINGEILGTEVYQTNTFKSAIGRKIKALDRFVNHFRPLYRARKVSMLFYTLTIANQSGSDIKDICNILKKRCKRNGLRFRGYFWISEISENLHWHYHLCLVTDRFNVKGEAFPDYLKVDDIWEAGTQVEFVKKDIKHYMAKYMSKHNYRILSRRSYGKSIVKI